MHSLSSQVLPSIQSGTEVSLPISQWEKLPERVLQFGTGVLLRGLPDYLIDKANRQGIFNGRIVVVKSTNGGDMNAFARQNSLYTLCIRGIENGQTVEENVVCSAISRVLSAKQQWADILNVAVSNDLQIVISNTTEVGIQLVQDDVSQTPPESFPGKLLAVLYARYKAFNGAQDKGLVIVPTELISDNGTALESILLELAHRNGLESAFIDWIETANTFCNSLVDRIVPGRPDSATVNTLTEQLGYEDDLLTISEVYRLWAIEAPAERGTDYVKKILSFHQADENVVITSDIDLFRELKLRLLNGTHTLSCGLAYLSGFNTVREAMEDEMMAAFIRSVMLTELIPGIPYALDEEVARRFGAQVLDRFRNPFIEHRWLGITMQYSAKMQLRNVATLVHYYHSSVNGHQPATPAYFSLGFAAYLLFMRGTTQTNEIWYGERNGESYPINDAQAPYFASLWATLSPVELTKTVLANTSLWGHDLSQLSGFTESVSNYLNELLNRGALVTLSTLLEEHEPEIK